ncbi:MAG TPA: hypothetical protein VGD60_01500 [Candidatus Acidoferrales bacterium]
MSNILPLTSESLRIGGATRRERDTAREASLMEQAGLSPADFILQQSAEDGAGKWRELRKINGGLEVGQEDEIEERSFVAKGAALDDGQMRMCVAGGRMVAEPDYGGRAGLRRVVPEAGAWMRFFVAESAPQNDDGWVVA